MPYKLQRRNNKKQKWKDVEYITPYRHSYHKGTKYITKLGASFDKKVTSLMNKGVEIRIVKTRKKRKR